MTFSVLRPVRVVLASAFLVLAVAALAGCSFEEEEKVWEISGPVFGTQYHINVVLKEDQDRLENLANGIEEVLEDIDASMSTWRNDSELSRFNRLDDQSKWTGISRSLYEVLATAKKVSELTGGAFDVTVGPVVNLWGFGPDARPEEVPTEDELSSLLAVIGHDKLALKDEPPALRADPNQYIDLSAIAKGYGVDAVSRFIESEGISAFLVEIGGEVRVSGRKPGGEAWRLAIEAPVTGRRQINRVVALEDQAMATSGDYRNYYESEGKRFSHTIDPKSGKPITHHLASVSVIAEDCMTADALATAFNVMGYEQAQELATRENIAAYFIVRGEGGFQTDYTPAFSSFLAN
ncbi:MAG: FAD:protein FMN transferase [Marinobacter sp.]|uniref:FAD:protein FMN transferase n=1 Tax=Marinobacter sp. TaxID=50741 RepID=UPI0032998BE6